MFKFLKKSKQISSKRGKELLIDLKKPKNKKEKDYIKDITQKYKEFHNIDIFDFRYLDKRLNLVNELRKSELRRGAKPISKEEQEFQQEWLIHFKESKRKSEDFAKRNKAAEQEIIELLKKYNYTDYLPGHKFNNPIFNKRFKSIEDEVFELTVKKCVEKYDRVNTCFFADESVPIKQKILKDRYGYDWCPEGTNYCEEFWDEYKAIKKKYHIFSEFLDNRR